MKKYVLLIPLLFFTLNFYAQKDEKIIDTTKTYFVEYDFKNGEYSKALLKPKVDRPIVFKIININRLAYDVKVNHSDAIIAETDLYSSAEDLKKITVLISDAKPGNQTLANESVTNPDFKPNSDISKDEKDRIRKQEKAEQEIKVLKQSSKLNSELIEKQRELDLLKSDNDKIVYYKSVFGDSVTISSLKKTEKKEITIKEDTIKSIQRKITKNKLLLDETKLKFLSALDVFNKAYSKFIESDSDINKIIEASKRVLLISNLPFLNKDDYIKEHSEIVRLTLVNLRAIDITSNTINSQYTNLVLSYNRLIDIDGLDYFILLIKKRTKII